MNWLPSEAQLLHAVLLNAAVFYASWRFVARRTGRDPVQRTLDTLLLWYGVQYAAVCLPGLVGGLSVVSITGVAIILSAGLAVSRWGVIIGELDAVARPIAPVRYDAASAAGAIGFAVGTLGAYLFVLRYSPVLSTDGLAYHMPVALGWLRSGWITCFDAWYWNPANAYSPLAGEVFITWLYAPLAGDPFAKFVQVGAGAVLVCAAIQIGRAAGLRLGAAAIVAAAIIVARPFRIEATIVKDDLFVAAFFFCAAAACRKETAGDRLGPYRLGLAVGLLIAVKYPALLTLPLLLLVADAPFRAGWRWKQLGIAVATAFVIAGPWFVRNILRFHNPLYPVDIRPFGRELFRGLFTLARDPRLHSAHGFWSMITEGHYGLPMVLTVPILLAAAITPCLAIVDLGRGKLNRSGDRAKRDSSFDLVNPFARFSVFCPIFGVMIFMLASPHPETRYFLPFMAPMFICLAILVTLAGAKLGAKSGYIARQGVLWLFLVGCGASTFVLSHWDEWILFPIVGTLVGVASFVTRYFGRELAAEVRRRSRLFSTIGAIVVMSFTAFAYVYWDAAVYEIRSSVSVLTWRQTYGPITEGWNYVLNEIPPDADLAYANTNLLYPLQHAAPGRRIIYVPVRADFRSFADLPYLGRDLDGYALPATVTAVMNDGADRDVWLKRIHDAGVRYLFVAKTQVAANPPELVFARALPAEFSQVFENEQVEIFRVEPTRR